MARRHVCVLDIAMRHIVSRRDRLHAGCTGGLVGATHLNGQPTGRAASSALRCAVFTALACACVLTCGSCQRSGGPEDPTLVFVEAGGKKLDLWFKDKRVGSSGSVLRLTDFDPNATAFRVSERPDGTQEIRICAGARVESIVFRVGGKEVKIHFVSEHFLSRTGRNNITIRAREPG